MKRVWIGVFAILAVCALGLVMMATNSPSADASISAGTTELVEQVATAPTQDSFAAEAGSSIMRMIIALAIVLACIYGCVFLLKRFGLNKVNRTGEKRLLEMIDSISVGPKKMIAVVRVGERAVVVGITDSQMTSLSELDKDEMPDGCLEKTNEKKPAPQNFASLFNTIWNGPVKSTKMTDSQTTQVA